MDRLNHALTRNNVRLTWGGISCLFVAACLTPAIQVEYGHHTSDLSFKDGSPIGLIVLLFGWVGGPDPAAPAGIGANFIPWSANLLLACGLAFFSGRTFRPALVLGCGACILGLTTWLVWGYERMLLGYYLWQASLLLLALGAGYALWRTRTSNAW